MKLGELILAYRIDHKISLRAFARAAKLSPTYVSYLEKGETQRGTIPIPSIETYKSVAKAMGITTDKLLILVDDEVGLNGEMEKEKPAVSSELENLSKEERKALFMQLIQYQDKDYLLELASQILSIASKKES